MSKLTNNISILTIALFMMFAIASQATAGGTLYVDDDAPAAGDGAIWDTAYRFLQDALTDAAGGGISEIHVAQGTYQPDRDEANPDGTGNREATFHLLNGVALMGGYAGLGAKDPNTRDIELYETILSGDLLGNDEPDFVNNDENSYHVTMGSDTDNTTLLEGFTITAGNANGEGQNERGGGFYASPTDATIIQCKFETNFCNLLGGGLYSLDGSPVIINSTFLNNKAGDGNPADGGGAAFRFDSFGAPTISGCNFIGNSATNVGGGLEFLGSFEDGVIITNCAFEGNMVNGPSVQALGGGGIGIFPANGIMQILNCTFTNNSVNNPNESFAALGAGLVLIGSEGKVFNCDFRGNSAGGLLGGFGGAVHVQGSGSEFVNCLVVSNSADFGGGSSLLGTTSYIDCTIVGNSATRLGGAAHSLGGAGILTNCILWDNGLEPIVDAGSGVTTVNHSDFQGGWTGKGSNNIDLDPMFVDPVNGDYSLLANSPCIDAADSSAVPEDIDIDLDGNPRFLNDPNTPDTGQGPCPIVDMGAYEFQVGTSDCCTWDLDGSGSVDTGDLLELFAQWGTDGTADFDGDGTVNTVDLLILFANWGLCG
ncbi:MAG: hypothetical protein IH984_10080 [Planctomycetes bacterium]|nr:hypothetical protein [Planctomycetota bacterium]